MRFLGIGEYNQLGSMLLRLQKAGHEVRAFVEVPKARDILKGLVRQTRDWRRELGWVREAGSEGIIIFESASKGILQDQLRKEGFNVIGGSAYGDRLEADRHFGQKVMNDIGLKTAPVSSFHSFDDAIDFVCHRRRRYVYKNNGTHHPSMANYIGEWEDGSDLIARLKFYREAWKSSKKLSRTPPSFILMDFISGIEVGVGAYFNGKDFLNTALLDWEHKRFFPGDLGELTGEMGTVVTYEGAKTLFEMTLAKMRTRLQKSGYCGYLNLNMIVNDQGVWPLEFTCRFGYPGFAICDSLHEEGWDEIFHRLVTRKNLTLKTRLGFSVGVVLTVPSFPYEQGYSALSKGTPICLSPDLTEKELENFHFGEMALKGNQLITAGTEGYVMVVTGRGASIQSARRKAYGLVKKVAIPNVRYRNDIGMRVIHHQYQDMVKMKYIKP